MGAIIGALYAGGYPARRADSLSAAFSPASLFSSTTYTGPLAWGQFSPLLTWAGGDEGFSLQTPTVDVPAANAMLSALLLRPNLLAAGDFDRLPIPFRAVATDLVSRDTVVLSSGDLAQAVRASISVPLVFPPEEIDGRLLVDGGLSANVPVAIARGLPGVTRVIVSDVTSGLLTESELQSGALAVADQLAGFLFVQPAESIGPGDVYMRVPLDEYENLDFTPATVDSIRRRGRLVADSVLALATCLPTGTLPRGEFPETGGDLLADRRRADRHRAARTIPRARAWGDDRPGRPGDAGERGPTTRRLHRALASSRRHGVGPGGVSRGGPAGAVQAGRRRAGVRPRSRRSRRDDVPRSAVVRARLRGERDAGDRHLAERPDAGTSPLLRGRADLAGADPHRAPRKPGYHPV